MDLGTMIVSYAADLSGWTSKINQVKSDLTSTSDSAQSSGNSIFGGFGKAISGVVSFGSQLGQTVIGIKSLADGAIGLGQALLAPAATAETTELSFETLLHSTKAAHQEMADLNSFAASTPMQTQWVDNAAAKILAFGGKTKDVKPEITAIGDSLSGLGKLSEASLNSIVDVFGKISAQGKITGGDMMQLSTWGIPAWQALSNSMHKPIPELQKMVSQGLLPASQAIPALEQGMEKTFGGGMQKQASTFAGLVSTLQSNWQIMLATIGTPVLKELEPLLSKLGNTLASPAFQTFATNVGEKIGQALTTVAGDIGTIVDKGQQFVSFLTSAGPGAEVLRAALIGIGVAFTAIKIGSFIAMIPELIATYGFWAGAAWGVVVAEWATLAPMLLVGAAIAIAVGIIVLAVTHWGQISAWLHDAWQATTSAVGGFFSGLGKHLHQVLDWIGGFFHTIWDGILKGLKIAGMVMLAIIIGPIGLAVIFIVQHWTQIKSFLAGIWSWIVNTGRDTWTNLTSGIGNAFSGLGKMVHNVWDGIIGTIKWAINGAIGLIDNFIAGIDSIGVDVGPVHIHPDIPQIPYLASGTNNFAGGWAVVGEKGPELVRLPGGSQVVPNGGTYPIKPSATAVASSAAMQQSASGSGGSRGNNTYILEVDGVELAKITQPHVDGLVRLKLHGKGRAA